MKCARCGLDLPSGTKQCPKCGLINEFVHSPDNKKRSPLLYVIIGLAALGLIALVVMLAAGNRNPIAAPPGVQREVTNIMAAPPAAPPESGIMAAPPSEPPTEKTPADVSKPKPPQSVVDYLAYVQKVEEHRQMLLNDTGAALMLGSVGGGLMSMINLAMDPEGKEAQDPLADSKKELNRQYKNWLQTLKFFDNKPAPAECREFSGAYRNVLYLETKAIGQIAAGFNSVNIMDPGDMSKLLNALQKMKKDSSIQGNIDKAADGADAQLKALVANYDMEKPFDVPREERGGNIMGF
ncbi:MAG: zinc ribbon domain-containing protein [Armatimonadetes bacterium]|nr:zinc ribbon domain-containing protein [Armatimonadota bacterium]